jgi:hypothetical protein
MRLSVIESGLRPLQKLFARVIRLVAGRMPGPILVMSYRKELFGTQMAACLQEAMRHAREWTVGEVELFAAFVSKTNQCAY